MFRRIMLYILCCEIVGASVFFGANYTCAWSTLVVSSWLIWIMLCTDLIFTPTKFPLSRLLLTAILLFSLSLSLQLFVPRSFTPTIAPSLTNAFAELNVPVSFPAVINPYQARLKLYEWIIPIVAFTTVPYMLKQQRDIYILWGCSIGVAGFQGVYGIVQFITASEPIALLARPTKELSVFQISGSYFNYNTYACFLGMGTLLAISLLLTLVGKSRFPGGVRKWRLFWINAVFFCILSMILGIFLSVSRGGILCLFAGIGIFICLLCRQKPSWRWRGNFFLYGCLLGVPLLSYFYIIGIEPALNRFVSLPADAPFRWTLWKVTWNICRQYFWMGCGGGCYADALLLHMPVEYRCIGLRYFAHNDYLHFLAEYGMISALTLSLVLLLWLRMAIRIRCGKHSLYPAELWCGTVSSIAVIALHSLVDFSMQITGHRLLCATLMGSLLAVKSDSS